MAKAAGAHRPVFRPPTSEFLPQRVAMLYRLSGRDTAAILLTSGVVAFGLWGMVADQLIVAWLIWLVLVSLVRHLLYRWYALRRPSPAEAEKWEMNFCAAGTLLGGAWGFTVLMMHPGGSQIHLALVPFLIGTMAMGLPATLAPSPRAFTYFIAPIMAPLIGLVFTRGGGFNPSAGILILASTMALYALYLSSHRTLMETLRSSAENDRLLRQLEQVKERLDRALESASLLLWEWDSRRGSMIFNGRWPAVLGNADLENRRGIDEVRRMVHPEDLPALDRAQLACMKAGGPAEYTAEHRMRTAGDDWVWTLSRGSVVQRDASGAALRMAGVMVDIDERKRAENELLAAMQREKELSEMKSKFVSIASHEFRTPLATIVSSAELLELYADDLDAGEKANLVAGIKSSANRMNDLIDGILVLGRAESGALKLNPAPLDLKELCQRVVAEFRLAQGSRHNVRLDDRFDAAQVEMDVRLLRHILENLLSNAAKYSPEGSDVLLRLTREGDRALIEVHDSGIGIPEADQPRLFQSFHRASNVDTRPGTGLGLAIVKKAVELHGGSISFKSVLGRGTAFRVALPVDPQTATA